MGQLGLVAGLATLTLAYFIVELTVLSLSAVATNGDIKTGGVYYLISRALGPAFGGSIGVIFYLANVFSSAMYVVGFVEAMEDSFGASGDLSRNALHFGRWMKVAMPPPFT